MTNQKKSNSNSFFKSVAHHNLERFHSETIAWIFNTFPITAKNFIKSIHTDISSIDKIELNNEYCWAELNQIDILLKYSYKEKNYQIIIENKMKASEHKIEAQKLLKKVGKPFDYYSPQLNNQEIKFLNFSKEVKLSQTEYYYIREKIEREENIEKCWYVYLKPSKINEVKFKNNNSDLKIDFDFKQLNTWNKKLGDNPWITITYEELIETIKNNDAVNDKQQLNENIIIANAYINFIEDNIKEEVYLDDFNKNKEYARFDYFKLLFALVKTKFKDVSILNSFSNDNRQNSIYEYIEAGSSNGGMPLFAFYKKVKLDEKYTFYYSNKKVVKNPKINVGIQVQGENFKYYVSADTNDYDNTVVNTSKNNNYGHFVKHVLNEITIDWESKNEKIFANDKGFHPNKTKTFYSRSYKIKNFIVNDEQEHRRDIFDIADEISEKVNHFVNHDITNSIDNYKFNI